MLRIVSAGAAAAALLTSSLLVAAPTPAVATTTAAQSASASQNYKPYGRASSTNHVLRRGCKYYSFSYRIHPPTDEWSAEIFVINPNGRKLLSAALDSASDPGRDKRRWSTQICRYSTVYGKHRIKMKITYVDGRDVYASYVRPSSFRFTRP